MAKDSFVFYREWMPLIKTLPDASRLKFYDMICAYEGGEFPATGDPHLDGVVQFVFTKVAENNKKYAKKCEKAAESAKMRWDANACERIETHADAMPKDANVKIAMLNDNDNDNDSSLAHNPSSTEVEKGKKKREKKVRVVTTKEKAISHYKTEIEKGRLAGAAGVDKFRELSLEICGISGSVDCPNGMTDTVMKLPEQLTFDQYTNLLKIVGGHESLRRVLLEVHNSYDQYHSKRTSLNLVLQGWNRGAIKLGTPTGQQSKGLSVPKRVEQ